jgi:hypothetical protein
MKGSVKGHKFLFFLLFYLPREMGKGETSDKEDKDFRDAMVFGRIVMLHDVDMIVFL